MERPKGASDSTSIHPSSLLKWLDSLYRPAWPEGIRRGSLVPPLSGPSDGASPSGKAVDFDSTIRRFESSRPSQPVRRQEILPSAIPEMPANGGLLRIWVSLQTSNLATSREKSPIVSGGYLK